MDVKPVVLFSRCLGFDACRYNGQKLGSDVVAALAPLAEVKLVCPEVEIGLGTPRKPVRLMIVSHVVRLVQPDGDDGGNDLTDAMTDFTSSYLDQLGEIDGAILKGRSPTCAVSDAKIYRTIQKSPAAARGPGVFAAALLERFPDAAVEDEGRLTNLRIREHFLTKLYLRARFRALRSRPSLGGLVQFQAENKLLLMCYHQAQMRELGRLVAGAKARTLDEVLSDYASGLARAFARPPRHASAINVYMHVLGYFSKSLSPRETRHFLALLESYRAGKTSLSAAAAVARSWIERFDNDYLSQQTFFEPFPHALVDPADSGKTASALERSTSVRQRA